MSNIPTPNINPYQSPPSSSPFSSVSESGGTLGDKTTTLLRQTRPWVIFLSIIGFLSAGLMLLIGLFVMALPAIGGMGAGGGGAAFPMVMGIVYVVMGLLYLMPSVFLFRYGKRIGLFLGQPNIYRLDAALEAQKSFWVFVGIMTLLVIVAYVIFIAGAIGFMGIAGNI